MNCLVTYLIRVEFYGKSVGNARLFSRRNNIKMSNDNGIRCRIKRSDRPCLICTGYMDLIEARPPKFNLFNGIPLVCNSEGIDCLDCPKCGFTTTTADYQYLRLCKSDRQGNGMFTNSRTNSDPRRDSKRSTVRHNRESEKYKSIHSNGFSHARNCSSCKVPLESYSWQFCPACGTKCAAPIPTPISSSPRTQHAINETAPKIPKDIIITDSNSITQNDNEEDNQNFNMKIDSKTVEKGIVRIVTPPKRTSINIDYHSSVEMQY